VTLLPWCLSEHPSAELRCERTRVGNAAHIPAAFCSIALSRVARKRSSGITSAVPAAKTQPRLAQLPGGTAEAPRARLCCPKCCADERHRQPSQESWQMKWMGLGKKGPGVKIWLLQEPVALGHPRPGLSGDVGGRQIASALPRTRAAPRCRLLLSPRQRGSHHPQERDPSPILDSR